MIHCPSVITATTILFATCATSSLRMAVVVDATSLAFQFGQGTGDKTVPEANNEQLRIKLPLGGMKYFDGIVKNAYLGTEGYVSLNDKEESTAGRGHFAPFRIPLTSPDPYYYYDSDIEPIFVAPYWEGNDFIKATVTGGTVYGRAKRRSKDRKKASSIVNSCSTFPNFKAKSVFVATWVGMNKTDDQFLVHVNEDDTTNTFQVALAYDKETTYAIFSYEALNFYSSQLNNDYVQTIAGFNDFDATGVWVELPGQGFETAFVDTAESMNELVTGTNCGQPGLYVYDITGTGTSRMLRDNGLALPYGPGTSDTDNTGNDVSDVFTLPATGVSYLGMTITEVYQTQYGYISFDPAFNGTDPFFYCCFKIPVDPPPIPALIAAYFADSMDGKLYARVTNDLIDLETVNDLVSEAEAEQGIPSTGFAANGAFVATWENVKPADPSGGTVPDGVNTFQAIFAYNDFDTWVVLSYDLLQWYAFGRVDVGGSPPVWRSQTAVGLRNTSFIDYPPFGFDVDFTEMIALMDGTNCGRTGTWVFKST